MGKKIKIAIFIAVIIIVAVFGFFISQNNATEKSTVKKEEPQAETLKPDDAGNEPIKSDPISIPAFSEKIFDGSDFKVGKILEQNNAYTRYYITYESAGLTISGIMNVPRGKGPFPVLFLNHGHINPEIYTNGQGLKREQDYLARNGYLVVHSDYRNHAGSDKEAAVDNEDLHFGYTEDVINGAEALKKAGLSYADTEKIGMLGHSMGGIIAEIIIVAKPDLVKAMVLFAPMSADQKDNYEKWGRNHRSDQDSAGENSRTPENDPEFFKNASPINFFGQVQVPIMIHHGTSDDSCALAWSEKTVKALKSAGKDAILYTYPEEPHEFIDAWPQVMKRTVEFFDKYVKLAD